MRFILWAFLLMVKIMWCILWLLWKIAVTDYWNVKRRQWEHKKEREIGRERCYCNSYGLYGTYIYIVIDSKAPWTFAVYLKPVMYIFIAHEMHFRKHANDISFSIYINSSIFLIHEHFSIMRMPIRTDGCFELHFSQ